MDVIYIVAGNPRVPQTKTELIYTPFQIKIMRPDRAAMLVLLVALAMFASRFRAVKTPIELP